MRYTKICILLCSITVHFGNIQAMSGQHRMPHQQTKPNSCNPCIHQKQKEAQIAKLQTELDGALRERNGQCRRWVQDHNLKIWLGLVSSTALPTALGLLIDMANDRANFNDESLLGEEGPCYTWAGLACGLLLACKFVQCYRPNLSKLDARIDKAQETLANLRREKNGSQCISN